MTPDPPSILSLGEVLWDIFPEGPRFGGSPANFACHAALLGANVTIASAVGDDPSGQEAINILHRLAVQTDLVQVLKDTSTGTVGITLDANVKPTFTIHEDSAWDRLAWSPELEARLATADAVYFGTLGQRSRPSRDTIRRALDIARVSGTPRILDINLRAPFFDDTLIRESIDRASILKLSDDELASVTTACGVTPSADPVETLHALRESRGLDLVVLTRGADGALLVSSTETIDQPGVPVEAIDTVGAGDSFTAALATGLLQGHPLADVAASACRLAAAVCTQPGAVPDLPDQRQPTA